MFDLQHGAINIGFHCVLCICVLLERQIEGSYDVAIFIAHLEILLDLHDIEACQCLYMYDCLKIWAFRYRV